MMLTVERFKGTKGHSSNRCKYPGDHSLRINVSREMAAVFPSQGNEKTETVGQGVFRVCGL